jgi:pimeloyl-ACP methyl ester carboxylesterase
MVKAATFDVIYHDAPTEQREQLQQFRAVHPYKQLKLGKVTWHYISSGEGSESLLILGGGLSVGETAFRTITRMEPDYRVLSPSYPPVGKMSAIVDGLAAILDAEGIKKTHVFGHSLGAAVAHILVRRYPERVGKLVLSGFGLYTPRRARGMKRSVRLLGLLPHGASRAFYMRRIVKLLAGVNEAERTFWLAYFEELLTVQHSKKTFMGQFKLLMDMFDHADAYRISARVERPEPTLIMVASDDTGFTASEREALIACYPGARVHMFASGGHWAGLAHQAEYNAVLDDFLGGSR